MQPVHGQDPEQVCATAGQTGHPERHPAQVGHRVAQRHGLRQGSAHRLRGQTQVRDEHDAAQIPRRIEAHRLDPIVRRGTDHEAAEQRGRGVVGMTLDLGRQAEQVARCQRVAGQGIARQQAADRGRRRRPEAARQRDAVVHGDPPPDAIWQRTADGDEGRLEAAHKPVVAVLSQLQLALTLDRQLDLAPTPTANLDLDPVGQVERQSQAVKAGPQVGAAGGHLHRDPSTVELSQPVLHHALLPAQHGADGVRARSRLKEPTAYLRLCRAGVLESVAGQHAHNCRSAVHPEPILPNELHDPGQAGGG